MKKRPMLLSAICASAISVIGIYTEKALFIICAIILIILFVMLYKYVKGELIFAGIVIFAVTLSTVFAISEVKAVNGFDGSVCFGEFVVVEEPVNHGEYYSSTLEAVRCDSLKSGTKVAVTYNSGEMQFSERIKAEISLKTMEENKMKYSYYSENIFLKGYILNFENTSRNDIVLKALQKMRNYIKTSIFKYYGKAEAATMLALVTGDKSYFTNRFYSNVKSAGVAHVMVVSGMHLSIIVSLALYLTNKLFYNRYFKAFVILFVTFLLSAICGFTMSIMRAGITYIFLALSLVINRENTPENTLGCAVCTVLLFNPFAIMNVAFQLSVLSTFSILAVALPVTEYVESKSIIKNKFLLSLFSSVLISISALIFTAPVTIYVFGYVSNVSAITNLLISSAVTAALSLCILGFIIPFLKPVLFFFSEILVRYINLIINFFGRLPFATTNTPRWVSFVVVAVIIAIIWILLACKNKRDMVKLREIQLKKYREGGKKIKWQ